MIIPKINSELLKDDQNSLTPIIIKGSAEEIDEKFIDTISQPLFKFNETALSIAQLEKDLEELKGTAKKAATSEKSKATKASKSSSTKSKLDKEEEEENKKEVKSPSLENTNSNLAEETKKDEKKVETRGDIVLKRVKQLENLGLVLDTKKNILLKDDFNVSLVEVKTLDDNKFSALVASIEQEMENRKKEPEKYPFKESSTKERTEKRIEYLKSLGFEYNKPKISWIKGPAEIKERSVELFTDDEFDKLVKAELDKEMKPEKVEGSGTVNAFSGNADKVGTKGLNEKKDIQAADGILKASKGENKQSFFDLEDDDDQEIAPNNDFDKEKEPKSNESSKDDDTISFF